MPDSNGAIPGCGYHHVALRVADFDATLRFYIDGLGFRPAVEWARSKGIPVEGPFSPDTLFYMAVHKKRFDAVVCMYHDQGHIPLKLLDFEGAVNVTLGLPIIRTSVDHGTAFDIAGKGIASTESLVRALDFAARLAEA